MNVPRLSWQLTLIFFAIVILALVVSLCLMGSSLSKKKPSEAPLGNPSPAIPVEAASSPPAVGISPSPIGSKDTPSLLIVPNQYAIQEFGDGRDGQRRYEDNRFLKLDRDTFLTNLYLVRSTLCTNGFRLFVSEKITMKDHSEIVHPGRGSIGANSATLPGGGNGGTSSHVDGDNVIGLRIHAQQNTKFKPTNRGQTCSTKGGGKSGTCKLLARSAGAFNEQAQLQYHALTRALNATIVLESNDSLVSKELNVPINALSLGGGGSGGGYDPSNGINGGGGGGLMIISAKEFEILDDTCTVSVAGGCVDDNGKGCYGGAGTIIINTLSHQYAEKLNFNISSGDADAHNGQLIFWRPLFSNDDEQEQQKEEEPESNQTRGSTLITEVWKIPPSKLAVAYNQIMPIPFINKPSHSTGLIQSNQGIEAQSVFTVAKGGVYVLHARVIYAGTLHEVSGTVRAWFRLRSKGEERIAVQQMGPNPAHGQVLNCVTGQMRLEAGEAITLMTEQLSGHLMKLISNIDMPMFIQFDRVAD